jgi:hypothetical protein
MKRKKNYESKTTRKEIAPAISHKKFLIKHLNQQIKACRKRWVVIGERKNAKNSAASFAKSFLAKTFRIELLFLIALRNNEKKSFLKLKFHSRFFFKESASQVAVKRIYESKTIQKEIAAQFRVKSSLLSI